MPVTGKELEPRISPDELAAAEVEGYIERIEKQAETKPSPTAATAGQPAAGINAAAAAKQAMAVGPKPQKQQIVLPLTEDGVRRGLHHKIWDAIRWLAEWSIYMIKKYPGRVFYPVERDQVSPDRPTGK